MALGRILTRIRSKGRALFPGLRISGARRRGILVLTYHEVLGDSDPIEAWTVVQEREFAQQMRWLNGHFKVVSLGEALRRMLGVEEFTENLAVVTFDDGYAGNRKVVLPIIESLGIPITLFVSTRGVQDQTPYWWDSVILALQPSGNQDVAIDLRGVGLGRYRLSRHEKGERRWTRVEGVLSDLKKLTPEVRRDAVSKILCQTNGPGKATPSPLRSLTVEELQQMAASPLVTLGAHSHRHDILIQLREDEMRSDVRLSRELLERWTGRKVCHFAYPNGDFDDTVINVLRETGFECAMAITPRAWRKSDSVFAIPRMSIGRYDSLGSFKAMLAGL